MPAAGTASYRPSEVRLDRLLELAPDAIRREGAAISPDIFVRVVAAAREYHAAGTAQAKVVAILRTARRAGFQSVG